MKKLLSWLLEQDDFNLKQGLQPYLKNKQNPKQSKIIDSLEQIKKINQTAAHVKAQNKNKSFEADANKSILLKPINMKDLAKRLFK